MPTSCVTASFFYFISLSYNLLTLIYSLFLSQINCKVSAFTGWEYTCQEQYLIRRLNSSFHASSRSLTLRIGWSLAFRMMKPLRTPASDILPEETPVTCRP